jgi:carbon storage regulator
MLVLTRKVGEKIVINNNVVLQVLSVKGGRIRLGIESPPDVRIWREELLADPAPRDADPSPGKLTPAP